MFSNYADCEVFAKSHDYNVTLYGWVVGDSTEDSTILRWHQPTGFFRLFRNEVFVREYRQ